MPLWIYQGGAELMGVRGVHGGGREKGGGSEASSLLWFPCCAQLRPLAVGGEKKIAYRPFKE